MERVRDVIASGDVGEVREISSRFHFPLEDQGDIRMSAELAGGSIQDVGCYPIRLARLLFESDWAAYTAAALLAVWPLHVGLSRGASLEVFAQLALVLLGLALALATRKPSLATLSQVAG